MTGGDVLAARLPKVAVLLALTAACVLTAMGLSGFAWPKPIPWADAATLLRFFGFLLCAAIAVGLLTRMLRGNTFLAAAAAAVVLALGAGAAWPLLVTLWFALACALTGHWLLQKLKAQGESWLTFFLMGAGFYGTLVGLAAHLPVNYPGSYGLALALPVVLGRKRWRQWFNELGQLAAESRRESGSSQWIDLAISVLALVYFLVALMPEVGHDALTMHLFIPAHLSQRHQWEFDVTSYVWAVMPLMGDWIFSMAYMLGGETAARLTNAGFIFALAWLVRNLVLWAGGSQAGARWAVLIFLSSPLTFAEGNSLFIEAVWASFAVAGTLAILKAATAPNSLGQPLIGAGALLAYAMAAKAVTLTLLPVLLLALIWQYKTWLKAAVSKNLLVGLGLFLLLACIPYVTAWWMTGNPIFPYFNQIFHSPLWTGANFEDPRWHQGLSWDFIYRVTFQTGRYLEATPGAAGFQWLLVFLPVLAVLLATRHRRGLGLVAVSVLSILLCFQSMAYLRYIFPAYAVLAAAIGVGLSALSPAAGLASRLVYGGAGAAVLLNLLFFSAGPFAYRDFPIKAIFSDAHRQAYLLHRLPIRNAVELVNALNPQGTPVAVFGTPQVAGLAANALMANWYNDAWLNAFMAVKTRQDVVDLLLRNRVDFVIADTPAPEQKIQRALLDQVTIRVAQFGSIGVLRFKDDFRFNKELLSNPNFSSAQGWVLGKEAVFNAASSTVLASASSPATQSIQVNSGQRYKNTVLARCYKEATQGRVQVNWHDAKGQFISPDIEVFACTQDWQEVSMQVMAPDKAARAEVYASGHTATPLEFKSVSFKQ